MTKEQGIEVLVKVALLAQSKGILMIPDAVIVAQALDAVKEKPKAPEAPKEDSKQAEVKKTAKK